MPLTITDNVFLASLAIDQGSAWERLSTALDAGGMGIWNADLASGALECSDRCRQNYGYPPGGVFGLREMAEAVHLDDRERCRDAARRALAAGGDISVEYRVVWPDGTVHWIHTLAQCSANGGERRMSGIAIDITDRKCAEATERERFAKVLAGDQRKSEFLAVLGHELRNPLAPIRNGLQVMRLARVGPAERERLRAMVERQVSHMAHLINDLRDVARVERGELRLEIEEFDAREPMRVAIEECAPLIQAKEHAFRIAGLERAALVRADRTRLAQMVSNLVNNAAKYTPDGGEITLKFSVDAGRLKICVRDNGVGLARQSLDQVFDLFVQSPEHKGRADGGLGIGLALTRKLAELHGGSVTASSEGPGKGCRFLIDLPARALETRESFPRR